MMCRFLLVLISILTLPTVGWSQTSIAASQQQNLIFIAGVLILALLVVTLRLLVQLITIRALSEKPSIHVAHSDRYLQQCDRKLVNKLIDFRTSRSSAASAVRLA